MVSSSLQGVIDKTHDIASNSVADLKPHAQALRSELGGYKEDFVTAAGSAYDSARRGARQVAGRAGDAYDSAKDYAIDGWKSTSRAARGHPLATVAIAAGVGLLVGAVLVLSKRK